MRPLEKPFAIRTVARQNDDEKRPLLKRANLLDRLELNSPAVGTFFGKRVFHPLFDSFPSTLLSHMQRDEQDHSGHKPPDKIFLVPGNNRLTQTAHNFIPSSHAASPL